MAFRPIVPGDAALVAGIWNENFQQSHPVDAATIAQILESPYGDQTLQWLALEGGDGGGRAVGFAWGRDDRAPFAARGAGYLSAIAVRPEDQGRGVGSSLYEKVAGTLADRGLATIRLGSDPDHLLPGVPEAAPFGAWRFFRKRGAVFGNAEFDLHLDLDLPLPPASLPDGHRIEPDAEAVVAFVGRSFPGRWHDEVRRYADAGVPLLALYRDADPVGFCAAFPPGCSFVGPSLIWRPALSDRAAGLGPIGIDESARGAGLGTAFFVGACAWLRDRGVTEVVINWTTLSGFYGKSGARLWRSYQRGVIQARSIHG